MVGLLASQGCVHPVCHRRVRVAVLAVGDHLVGPAEAPVMHRERNAANAAIVALALRAGAMPHDLQAVPESRVPDRLRTSDLGPGDRRPRPGLAADPPGLQVVRGRAGRAGGRP